MMIIDLFVFDSLHQLGQFIIYPLGEIEVDFSGRLIGQDNKLRFLILDEDPCLDQFVGEGLPVDLDDIEEVQIAANLLQLDLPELQLG